jgi:hypothetical protein
LEKAPQRSAAGFVVELRPLVERVLDDLVLSLCSPVGHTISKRGLSRRLGAMHVRLRQEFFSSRRQTRHSPVRSAYTLGQIN